ncbi:MAG: cytochrome C552, partial [Gammaproteobacteria bacterium]|nr:cytochrome C552 [Gammaproteobacteria bacterium]
MSDENFIESCEHAKNVLGRRTWTVLVVAMFVGIVLWGGFNWAMEATNSMDFCLSCHEMKDNVYKEYLGTVHDSNRSGVRATCPDCHVPRPWIWKVKRKIQASNEVLHKILGTVDTPEKFDAKRLQLATNVWRAMRDTDSRECRNCHDFGTMNPFKQKPRARKQHMNAMRDGNTCIDCHKGIAHKKVHDQLDDELAEEMSTPKPEYVREVPQRWLDAEQKEKDDKEAEKRKKKEAAIKRKEAQKLAAAAAKEAAKSAPVAVAPSAGAGGIDWGDVPDRQIVLFYPGQSSMEWVLKGTDHGGARPFIKGGEPCTECHDQEADAMGQKIVTGEKLEPTVIEGKRGSIPVSVK